MAYLRAKKYLGQHFLKDRRIINRIINKANFSSGDTWLEVGPGKGALTIPLSRRVKRILAVEKDKDLAFLLKERLNDLGINNVSIICADILKMDISRLKSVNSPINIIGNLPFNISSPFLELLTKERGIIGRTILMFQEEFARRLIAQPSTKEYGAISVWIQYHARVRLLLSVPPRAYYPVPKVGGMVLEIDFQRPYFKRAEDEKIMKRLIKAAFSHRRKTLLNSLSASMPDIGIDNLKSVLKNCSINVGKRAEQLGIDDYLCLTSEIAKTKSL